MRGVDHDPLTPCGRLADAAGERRSERGASGSFRFGQQTGHGRRRVLRSDSV